MEGSNFGRIASSISSTSPGWKKRCADSATFKYIGARLTEWRDRRLGWGKSSWYRASYSGLHGTRKSQIFRDRSLSRQRMYPKGTKTNLIRPMNWFPASSKNEDDSPGTTVVSNRSVEEQQRLTQDLVKQEDELDLDVFSHRVAHTHPSGS